MGLAWMDSRAAIALSALFVVALAAYYVTLLPIGNLALGDEFLTLDRVNGFVTRGDYLTVYTENKPDFRKPPLQYWLSAALIQIGVDLTTALRFPSYVFSILALISTGFLARALSPLTPYAAPAAIALLAGSQTFWTFGTSAMLDSGATLFSTLAIAGFVLALRQPLWWYLVAFAVALSALQKAPAPLAMVILMSLVVLASSGSGTSGPRASFRNRHFIRATPLTAAALLVWPIIQMAQHGAAELRETYLTHMFSRFSPSSEARYSLAELILEKEALIRVPGILALAALPYVLRRRELVALPALLLGFALIVGAAGDMVYPRYSIPFLPLLMAALAVVIIRVLASQPLAALALIVALSFASSGPFKTSAAVGNMTEGQTGHLPLLRNVAAALRDDETLVVCRGKGNPHVGAISYYASNGRPFLKIATIEQFLVRDRDGRARPPYRGICNAAQADLLRARFGPNAIVEEANGAIHWQGGAKE